MVHKWPRILLSVLLHYRTAKRLLIPGLKIRVRNYGNFTFYCSIKTYAVGTLLKPPPPPPPPAKKCQLTTRVFVFYALKVYATRPKRHTTEMLFRSHCYTVVSNHALYRLVYTHLGCKVLCFCMILDFGSPNDYRV